MSVTANNIVAYGSVNMPGANGLIIVGPVDFTKRIAFYDINPAGTVDVVSSSAGDTATKVARRRVQWVSGREDNEKMTATSSPRASCCAARLIALRPVSWTRHGPRAAFGASLGGRRSGATRQMIYP